MHNNRLPQARQRSSMALAAHTAHNAWTLIQLIHNEFGSIPFPSHCGLRAAMAKDDWVADEEVLREITRSKDYIGEWWNVPLPELRRCMMALCYLDPHGLEFYLPAYMVAVVQFPYAFDGPRMSSAWQVLYIFLSENEDPDMRAWWREKVIRIADGKKRACRSFLEYMATSPDHSNEATRIAREALGQEFWR